MKPSIIFVLVVAFALAAMAACLQQANDIKIVNSDNMVKFSAISPASQTNPWLEFGSQTNTVFSVNANGSITLAASTNVFTFGALTTTAPVSGTPTNYIFVGVSGDTNIYRMALLK